MLFSALFTQYLESGDEMLGVYSLDNVVIDLKVRTEFLSNMSVFFSHMSNVDFWPSSKPGKFKYNYSVSIDSVLSFYVGFAPVIDRPNAHWTKCRLDYNPSKVSGSPLFQYIKGLVFSHGGLPNVKRYDVAIDVPVCREDIWLYKDQRMYTEKSYSSSNKTEYLGQRSAHGYVKLYNKQLESNLKLPVSRLEITMDYDHRSYGEFERLFPEVHYSNSGQMVFEHVDLSCTDKVLVLACLEHPKYLKMLGRDKRKKISSILSQYTDILKPDYSQYSSILAQLIEECNYNLDYYSDYVQHVRSTVSDGATFYPLDGDSPWDNLEE